MRSWTAVAAASVLLVTACGGRRRPADAFAVADSLRDAGRFALAKPVYRALRDAAAARRDTAGWWRAQLWWGEMLLRTGRPDSAHAAIATAVRLAGTSADRRGWSRWLTCGYWSRLGNADSAIAACDQALGLADTAVDHVLSAETHKQLGTVWSRRGRYRHSVPETETAVALERRYGHSPAHLAAVLNNMGIEYANVGRLRDADSAYEAGLRIARRIGNGWLTEYLYSNLSDLHALTGDLEGATDLMRGALQGAEALADTSTMVYAHNGFAELYLRVGNLPAARAELEISLAMNARVPRIFRATALTDLGLVELAEGKLDAARRQLTAALAVSDAAEFGMQRTQGRVGLARVALGADRPADALRWANAAVTLADSLGDPAALVDALAVRAEALEAAKRSDASQAFLDAVALLESWRGRLAVGDLAIGVVDPHWEVYEGAVRTLMASGHTAEAFGVAERARARMLLQVMATRDAARLAATARGALEARLRERFQEWTAADNAQERAGLDREIAALADSIARAERRARARNPLAAPTRAPASLAMVRADLLDAHSGLLEIFWGDRAVYGWWITRDAIRGARLGAADSLAALVDFLQGRLRDEAAGIAWRAPARAAYHRFVAPLSPDPVARVVVLLDGPLAHIPMEALIPDGDSVPWGARVTFTYGPSASVLVALSERKADTVWNRAVLAVGNPSAQTQAPSRDTADARGAPTAAERPLPFAEREARVVRDLFRDAGGDLLVGHDATLARWLALRPSRYRYLHFAAHAEVNDRQPQETHIVLAAGSLDLAAVRRLDLHAQLVTLSACETALGHRVRGEGVIGLPYAFLAAGAHAVVVSLWAVGDAPTADFMDDFYRELKRGRRPADALAEVRRRYMSRYPPSDWAPFVLVGES